MKPDFEVLNFLKPALYLFRNKLNQIKFVSKPYYFNYYIIEDYKHKQYDFISTDVKFFKY